MQNAIFAPRCQQKVDSLQLWCQIGTPSLKYFGIGMEMTNTHHQYLLGDHQVPPAYPAFLLQSHETLKIFANKLNMFFHRGGAIKFFSPKQLCGKSCKRIERKCTFKGCANPKPWHLHFQFILSPRRGLSASSLAAQSAFANASKVPGKTFPVHSLVQQHSECLSRSQFWEGH